MSKNLPKGAYLSVTEAAAALGVSPDTLRRLEKKGKIKPIRDEKNKRVYLPKDLEIIRELIKTNTPSESLVTIQQAARIMGLSVDTLRRWEKEGRLESVRTPGGHRRYKLSQVTKPKAFFAKTTPIKEVRYFPANFPTTQKIDYAPSFLTQEIPSLYRNLDWRQKKVIRFITSSFLTVLTIFAATQAASSKGMEQAMSSLSNYIPLLQKTTNTPLERKLRGQVLQATDVTNAVTFGVNVATVFRDDVNIETNLTVEGDAAFNGGNLTSTATAFNLLDTDVLSLNIGGEATAISLGAATGTTIVNNALTSTGTLTASGDVAIRGVTYTFPTTQGAASTFLKNNGSGTLSWSTIVTDLSSATGTLGLGSGGTGSTTVFAAGSVIFSDGTKLTQDNTNFYWDDTNNILRIGSGGAVNPSVNLGADLGAPTLRWNNLYVGNVNSNASLSLTGQALFTYDPADTTYTESSVLINPTAPEANEWMLGIGQGGFQRAGIDAEGDLVIGYDDAISAPSTSNPLAIYNHGSTLLATIDTTGNLSTTGSFTLGGMGTASTTEGTIYYDTGIDHLYLRTGDAAWHRLAQDMTKYSDTNASVANGSYIEIAHNQNTSDLVTSGWVYDTLQGKWITIADYTEQTPSGNFGTGADGAITIDSSKNINTTAIASGRTYADGIAYRVETPMDETSSVTKYATTYTLNGIVPGDELLLINLGGASGDTDDVGNYEYVRVKSVTASDIIFTHPITKSYNGTTAANQKVVIQRIPQYTDVTIDSGGALIASVWDQLTTLPSGTAGYLTGIVAFRANGTTLISSGGSIDVSASGYSGGAGGVPNGTGFQGESSAPGAASQAANLGGGGGGKGYTGGVNQGGTGAGGGYGAEGSAGTYFSGNGGSTVGAADLSQLFLGSGGGGGGGDTDIGNGGTGGKGGGIVFIGAETITIEGTILTNGAAGGSTSGWNPGGGGSGGSVFLAGQTITVGTSLITSSAGAGGTGANATGGAGGVGRVRIEYTSSLSGTTSPAASTATSISSQVTPAYLSSYQIVQTDADTVRLYNYSGSAQNLRLDIIVQGADLAEWYTVDDSSIESGDTVAFTGEKDENGVPLVVKADRAAGSKIAGIISTKAGQELGLPGSNRRLVALSGRVPVKIDPGSQPIFAGDFLTASETQGYAQKATQTGYTVARALEDWSPESGRQTILAFIGIGQYSPNIALTNSPVGLAIKPDSSDSFISFMEEDSTILGKIQNNSSGGILYTTAGNDFAEYFKKADIAENLAPGDLICIAEGGSVTRCNENNSNILGVISDGAGFAGGGDHEGDPNFVLVGLLGQLDIKVATDSGIIRAGDALTASAVPGVAQKATHEGFIIGKALEDWEIGKERLLTYISASWFNPKMTLLASGEIGIESDGGDKLLDASSSAIVNVDPNDPLAVANALTGQSINADLVTTTNLVVNQKEFSTYLDELEVQMETIKTDLNLVKANLLTSESLNTASDSAVLGTSVFADVVVSGKLNVGALALDGLTNSLDAIGTLKIQSLALGSIEFQNNSVEIDKKGNLYIKQGLIIANANLRNSEILPAGERTLTVSRTWEETPVSITATPNYNTRVWVSDKTQNGFTINVETPPLEDATIDWIAIW